MDFLNIGRAMHLQYGYAFVVAGFYSSMRDHEAQELASTNPESTSFQVKVHVVFVELSKDLF